MELNNMHYGEAADTDSAGYEDSHYEGGSDQKWSGYVAPVNETPSHELAW